MRDHRHTGSLVRDLKARTAEELANEDRASECGGVLDALQVSLRERLGKGLWREVSEVGCLSRMPECPVHRLAEEHNTHHLVSASASVVRDDHVGIRVDPNQIHGLHVDARLLLHLTYDCLDDSLTGLDAAARQNPVIVVGATDQEESPVGIGQCAGDRQPDGCR